MNARILSELVATYADCSGDERSARLEARLRPHPRCPVARYLLACDCFDRGRAAVGVQHMMIAYHAEPDLQSAALLAFAGLSWVSRPSDPLLPVLLETWEEFRRPGFDRTRKERLLLDAFTDNQTELHGVGPLARRLWRLPIRMLRVQIREAVLTRNVELYPILLSPA